MQSKWVRCGSVKFRTCVPCTFETCVNNYLCGLNYVCMCRGENLFDIWLESRAKGEKNVFIYDFQITPSDYTHPFPIPRIPTIFSHPIFHSKFPRIIGSTRERLNYWKHKYVGARLVLRCESENKLISPPHFPPVVVSFVQSNRQCKPSYNFQTHIYLQFSSKNLKRWNNLGTKIYSAASCSPTLSFASFLS